MNQEEIIRIAEESNLLDGINLDSEIQVVIKFANLIAAVEREECAKMIEGYSQEYWNLLTQRYAAICIRNRGK